MRSIRFVGMLGCVLLAGGCVRSLHPLYTKDKLAVEPAVVGTWTDDKEEDVWSIRQSGDHAYTLVYHQHEVGDPFQKSTPGDSAAFDMHLVRLGEYLFMDLAPELPAISHDLASMVEPGQSWFVHNGTRLARACD